MSSRRTIDSGALFVCSVANTRWPVSEASMPVVTVSLSRISPTMMMSGSQRRNARIATAKVEAGLGIHLHLAQPALRDFHRVLGGPDLGVRRVEVAQHRVQRRGLAGAGRPADEEQPVRLRRPPPCSRSRLCLDSASLSSGIGSPAPRIRITMSSSAALRRDGGDAQLDVERAELLELDLAVLRLAPLGDVEVAHDLDARRDRVAVAVGHGDVRLQQRRPCGSGSRSCPCRDRARCECPRRPAGRRRR